MKQTEIFSYVAIENRTPKSHALGKITAMADAVLLKRSPDFDALYSEASRPSVHFNHGIGEQMSRLLWPIFEKLSIGERNFNALKAHDN